MTDLAIRTSNTTDLEKWLHNAGQTHQIAIGLAKSSFVPKSMQGRPDEITAAILAGQEIGLDPMSALRSIDIIDGTPALRAVTLRALVQSRGHRIWVEESTSMRAVVKGQRRGENKIEQSVWNMDRARNAGLADKKNWKNHPNAMLVARATAEVARLIAADAILGMPYTIEEIQDGVVTAELGEPVPADPPRLRAMRRASAWQRADTDAGVPEPPVADHQLDSGDAPKALAAEPSDEPDWPRLPTAAEQ